MNMEDFIRKYPYGQKKKVEVSCTCGKSATITRENALNNITRYGEYLCRSCSMKLHHKQFPRGEDTRTKQSRSMKGLLRSEETKKKMSELKKVFYQTENGILLRKKLAEKATKQHASTNIETTRRRGLFPSRKNHDFMVYGSSYELRAHTLLENDDSVEGYESQVPFEIEGRHRSLDLLIHYNNGRLLAVEIKSHSRLDEEKVIHQIEDNRKYSEKMGYDFEVWTETDLGFNTSSQATKWADDFVSRMTAIDYVEIRRQSNASKARRHYHEKLAHKIEVYCQFCKTVHEVREIQYFDNIEKNGRFICIRENGHIQGSRPKDHVRNLYESIGKKKCSGKCGQILDLNCFSVSDKKTGKRCSQCKRCRANKAFANYESKKR